MSETDFHLETLKTLNFEDENDVKYGRQITKSLYESENYDGVFIFEVIITVAQKIPVLVSKIFAREAKHTKNLYSLELLCAGATSISDNTAGTHIVEIDDIDIDDLYELGKSRADIDAFWSYLHSANNRNISLQDLKLFVEMVAVFYGYLFYSSHFSIDICDGDYLLLQLMKGWALIRELYESAIDETDLIQNDHRDSVSDVFEQYNKKISYAVKSLISKTNVQLLVFDVKFLATIYRLTDQQSPHCCCFCQKLSQIAEDVSVYYMEPYYKYMINRPDKNFYVPDSDVTKDLIYATSFLTPDRDFFGELFYEFGNLEHLLQDLSNRKLRVYALESLRSIGQKQFRVTVPEALASTIVSQNQNSLMPIEDDKVEFIMDDAAVLRASRVKLSSGSIYFEKLLAGAFKEAKETIIPLPDVDSECLALIIHCLEHNVDIHSLNQIDLNLPLVLNTLVLCRRFMLEQLFDNLTQYLCQHILNIDTLDIIFDWASQWRMESLQKCCIIYLIVNRRLDRQTRLECLGKLIDSDYNSVGVTAIRQRYSHEYFVDARNKPN